MSDDKATASRRDFLRLAGLAAPAAAVTVVTGKPAEAAVPSASDGYRETEHVRKFYESARF
ncbi:twin-arginine translocation signal domain-containing protein [Limibaculum sp. M0105]|uniref:Twin-arginine translocation signal domain-containing protein n=1 Tax=Thermohalobaculum xanthum TaxID=2753746 RepID=A0A8J7SBJ1_9RHOB|nr:twin-arginine translocation signal domain-containing protein [Thermohalobaculum xanthum]MBK0397651.1 twin-arginine translocation signal domain-containing protein [Thermohalobaculum xanthum]